MILEWINIEDRKPSGDDIDILVVSDGEVCFCHHGVDSWGRDYYETPDVYESEDIKNITHWMPLPDPPQK